MSLDDFLSILIVAIIYIAVGLKGSKKKKKARRASMQQDMEHRLFEQTPPRGEKPAARQMSFAEERMAQEECADKRLHLHDVTQEQFHDAAEGEDPCHAGSAPLTEAEPTTLEQEHPYAQDVLRGVIMSEILTRPCERMAVKRNGRRA